MANSAENSKSMSHALYSPTSPYPVILVARGHLLDSMGISVRRDKGKARAELLPEEALFLLDRGSLQIWVGPEDGEWNEEECGITGAIEMSVSEGFAAFLGKDNLTWERYQVSDTTAMLIRPTHILNVWGIQSSAPAVSSHITLPLLNTETSLSEPGGSVYQASFFASSTQ